jgi:hypothetical protein
MVVLAVALGARLVRTAASGPAPPAMPAVTFLGLRPLLEDAGHYLSSPEHNPTGVDLSAEDRVRLQDLIDEANVRLSGLQSKVGEVARNWARLCIAIGNFDLVVKDQDRHHHPGTLLLRVADRYGIKRDVVIQPGECADLDVLTADIDAESEAAHRQIADFLKSHAVRSDTIPEEALRCMLEP